jgi:hypothetical protein
MSFTCVRERASTALAIGQNVGAIGATHEARVLGGDDKERVGVAIGDLSFGVVESRCAVASKSRA